MIKNIDNNKIFDSTLHLIIGEGIPDNSPTEFSNIKLYIRDDNNNLHLYADISLPYLINHSKFLDIKDDPRYFFKEGFDPETKGYKHICEIKPLGDLKGVYRILNGKSIKIMAIDTLFELNNNIKKYSLSKNKLDTSSTKFLFYI